MLLIFFPTLVFGSLCLKRKLSLCSYSSGFTSALLKGFLSSLSMKTPSLARCFGVFDWSSFHCNLGSYTDEENMFHANFVGISFF